MTGDHVEKHYHNGGTNRILWAWAGAATLIVIGVIAAYAGQQWTSNNRMADAIVNLGGRMGRMEGQIEILQRTIERLERELERQRNVERQREE